MKIEISKKEVLDFLNENVRYQSCANGIHYFIGAKKDGEVYESRFLASSNSWTNFPGIKICKWNGFNYTNREYVYQLFSEVDNSQAALNLQIEIIPEEWKEMDDGEKTDWVMEYVDSDVIEDHCNFLWEEESIACALGIKSMASATIDSWLVIAERDNEGKILHIKSVKVDGKKVKENTWYQLINNRLTKIL